MLERLYSRGWDVNKVAEGLVRGRDIMPQFIVKWRDWLEKAIKQPRHSRSPNALAELINELIEKNLIMYFLPSRDPGYWVDAPPPERDPELGVGKHVAWQTPLHKEAVKRILKGTG